MTKINGLASSFLKKHNKEIMWSPQNSKRERERERERKESNHLVQKFFTPFN